MTINALEPVVPSRAQTDTAGSSGTLDKDDFLNLLVTQLQNQDPLEPLDSTEFTAQLAQFSSLEQLTNINENLETLETSQSSINNSQAVGFIGKTVTVAGNSISMEGDSEEIRFELAENAERVLVGIYDSSGNLVREMSASSLAAGQHVLEWDGRDSQSNQVANGTYTFEVLAVDADNLTVEANTYTEGIVTGITYTSQGTYLVAGDRSFPLANVVEVGTSEE
jgi:flagellar basal-body rod modification protein FlgD